MKRILITVSSLFIFFYFSFGQVKENADKRILFQGLVIDASNLSPVSNTQIMINRAFSSVSDVDGSFAFYVNMYDTVVFKSLGYKPAMMFINDTLRGRAYIAGIYMNSDTLSIGEVVIIPRHINLRSEIMNARDKTPATMQNARYNVAISAYQGKNSRNVLGDPETNYRVISQKQKVDAFEKGGIPSSMIAGVNPLFLIPVLVHSLATQPEPPPAFSPQLNDIEVEQIHNKYIESLKQKK